MNEQLYHLRNTETGEIADTRYLNAELVASTNRRATDIPRFPWQWMPTEPAPVRHCHECHAAPAKSYSRLCEGCYAIACEEIRAELAQESAAIVRQR